MLKACPIFTPGWWEVPGQDDDSAPTRFLIKGLLGIDHHEAAMYMDHGRDGSEILTARTIEIAISRGVVEVENLDGYDPMRPLHKQLPSNPVNIAGILAYEIMSRSVLLEPEKKDSASASKSGESPENSSVKNAAGDDTATPTAIDPEAEAGQATSLG